MKPFAAGHFTASRPWVDHGWNVYLDSDEDVLRALAYVNNNPVREDLAPQTWGFVIPYDPAQSRRARTRI